METPTERFARPVFEPRSNRPIFYIFRRLVAQGMGFPFKLTSPKHELTGRDKEESPFRWLFCMLCLDTPNVH